MRWLALLLATSCVPELPAEVACTGTRPMVCTCVTWCVTTEDLVLVEPAPACPDSQGPLCFAPDGGTP
jgi:hypothetical protein